MTGRAATRALVAAVATLALVCLFLLADAYRGPERVVVDQEPHTSPRTLP